MSAATDLRVHHVAGRSGEEGAEVFHDFVQQSRPRFARGDEGAPLLPSIDARRVFDIVLVTLSWRWARALARWVGTDRLQPQLRWLVLAALAAPLWPAYHLGFELRPPDAAPLESTFLAIAASEAAADAA